MKHAIKALFLDIGGVLATNGWDHPIRLKACEKFGLKMDEMDERHNLTFDAYERGKLTLDEYLNLIVFYEPRSFTLDEFKAFIFDASKPFPDTINFFRKLKAHHHLKIVAVSNEGRELNLNRIKKFDLGTLFDFFISSSFVHVRKPDLDIYQMALDTTQIPIEEIVYVDDRVMLTDVANMLGFNTIQHKYLEHTKAELLRYGLGLGHSAITDETVVKNPKTTRFKNNER